MLIPGLIVAQRSISVNVTGEKWWITTAVAVGAALLGSFAGAGASYRANTALENRRRKALSEIRRKAKVYTPIREELGALRRGIEEDRHLSSGILREPLEYQTWRPAPVLSVWHDLVVDGRASTSASARVRTALDQLESRTVWFNEVVTAIPDLFKSRGEVIAEQTGFSPTVGNWAIAYFATILRRGIKDSEVFNDPISQGPGSPASRPLSSQEQTFAEAWEADEHVREAQSQLERAEQDLVGALDSAVSEVDHAMKRIADKYEHEPRD